MKTRASHIRALLLHMDMHHYSASAQHNHPQNSLFVIDEAGMVGTQTWVEFSKIIFATYSELVLSGDDLQLPSVERGGIVTIMV